MKPITQAVDKMQGENTMESYFGLILPTLCVIQRKLTSFTPTDTASLVSALQTILQKRFGNILNFDDVRKNNKIKAFVVAAVAHPYFKVRWL